MAGDGHRRVDETRMRRVHADLVGLILDRWGLREDPHRTLRSMIGGIGVAADDAAGRRDVDDRAPARALEARGRRPRRSPSRARPCLKVSSRAPWFGSTFPLVLWHIHKGWTYERDLPDSYRRSGDRLFLAEVLWRRAAVGRRRRRGRALRRGRS